MHKVSTLLRFSWKFHYVFVVVGRQPIGALTETLVSVQKKLSSVHDGKLLLLTNGKVCCTQSRVCGNYRSAPRKRKEARIA